MKTRRAHFRVDVRLNGAAGGTVTIEQNGTTGLFTVRPRRMRKTYTMTLGDVAEYVVFHLARQEAKARLAARKAGRKR